MDKYSSDSSRDASTRDRKKKSKKSDHSSKKKSKKDKKEKHKRRRYDSSDEEDSQPIIKRQQVDNSSEGPGPETKAAVDELEPPGAADALYISKPVSKLDFFNHLLRDESMKGQVGTAHAVGREANAASAASNQDWTCPKCSTSNFKNSNQCQKCHALKRLSQYR